MPIYLISFEANSATLQATYNQRSTYEGGGTYDSIKLGALAQQKESGGNDESIRKNFYQSFTFNDGDWIVNSGISNMTQRVRVPGFDYYEIQNYITFNNSNVTAKSLTNQGYYTQSGGSAHYSSVYNSSVTYDWLSGSWSYGSIIVTDGDFYVDGNFQSNSKTNYQHTGGSGYIGTLSGSGNISLVNTNYGLGTLSSGAYVNSQNSTLTVETIDLTNTTCTASNTDLITTADQVADYQTDNRIAKLDIVDSGSDDNSGFIDGSSIGDRQFYDGLKDSFVNNVDWTGGSMHFNGSYSQSLVTSITNAIHSTFGDDVEVSFEKVTSDAPDLDGLSTELINQLLQATGKPEIILYTVVWNANNQPQIIGFEASRAGVDQSIGFKTIKNNTDTTITNGKTLVLLGETIQTQIAEGILRVDNGTLRLGSNASEINKGGKVNVIYLSNNGQLIVQGGDFSASSISGQGDLIVRGSDAELLVKETTSILGGNNSGTLNLKKDFNIDGDFVNTGTIHLESGWQLGEDSSFVMTEGLINTGKISNIFDNVHHSVVDPIHTVSVFASLPEEVKVTTTELLMKYVPGTVAQQLVDHATFNGGKVVITGVDLTETMRDDLTTAFKETFFIRFQKAFPKLSALWVWA